MQPPVDPLLLRGTVRIQKKVVALVSSAGWKSPWFSAHSVGFRPSCIYFRTDLCS